MQIFIDDDQGYMRWLDDNPHEYVINADRRPNASYMRLHRARCRTISGHPASGRAWTVTSAKACGSRDELEAWAAGSVGGPSSPCPTCL